MKTVGKSMKAASLEGQDPDLALRHALKAYREIPHVTRGQTPGNMLRDGYAVVCPRKGISDQEALRAHQMDRKKKRLQAEGINASPRRVPEQLQEGDIVLLRD